MNSWIRVEPDKILVEIEKTIISQGLDDQYFKFKTLTPIFGPTYERITNSDYWLDNQWDFSNERKKESLMK